MRSLNVILFSFTWNSSFPAFPKPWVYHGRKAAGFWEVELAKEASFSLSIRKYRLILTSAYQLLT
jgi:hypothetical protein